MLVLDWLHECCRQRKHRQETNCILLSWVGSENYISKQQLQFKKCLSKLKPVVGIYTFFVNIKSINTSILGLKPHLLDLRKQRYIFFSYSIDLTSYCTFGKCPLSHSNTHISNLPTVFTVTSQDSSTKAASENFTQCFWTRHHHNSSYMIFLTFNQLTFSLKMNHVF